MWTPPGGSDYIWINGAFPKVRKTEKNMQALAFAFIAQKGALVPPFFIFSMDSIVCKERSVNFVGGLNLF